MLRKAKLREIVFCPSLDALQSSIELFVLLKEDESSNSVRTQADEARHPTTEGPGKAFFAADLTQQANNALATALSWGCTHNTSLDHIDRTANGCCDKPRHERGCEMRAEVITHADCLNTHFLESII